jgi:hypothetical protein
MARAVVPYQLVQSASSILRVGDPDDPLRPVVATAATGVAPWLAGASLEHVERSVPFVNEGPARRVHSPSKST